MADDEKTENPHHWVPSTLGHGHMMCDRCKITMMEAAAIGEMNHCEK
ncbi:MAG: hypothetical protein IPO08_22085 [Xanthomonadales bacterium]|nr:hypothetical protein [Xanthomonadales bacterium]